MVILIYCSRPYGINVTQWIVPKEWKELIQKCDEQSFAMPKKCIKQMDKLAKAIGYDEDSGPYWERAGFIPYNQNVIKMYEAPRICILFG